MSALELAIWSAAAGAIGLVALVCLADMVTLRLAAGLQGAGFNLAALLFVVLLSGLPEAVFPAWDGPALRASRVLAGPLCVFLGDRSIRAWLTAAHRDRLMDACLAWAGWTALAAGLACLLLPVVHQLPAAAVIVLLNTGLVIWVGVRAWLLGDTLALGLAAGGALMLPTAAGLYAVAMELPGVDTGWQALIALNAVLCMSVIGYVLLKRSRHQRRTHRAADSASSHFDPVTKLPGGLPFVRQLLRAQRRRRHTRREGAVIAAMLFGPERIVSQAGAIGLNEVYLHLAHRLQRQVGVVNPVGRYWERCFVALVESIHARSALRTLGLRVANSLRQPVRVTAPGGGIVELRVDIGVGVVHLGREPVQVEDLLHEAQLLAEAARGLASRAAMRDPATGEAVPLEHAPLEPRRRVGSRPPNGRTGGRARP